MKEMYKKLADLSQKEVISEDFVHIMTKLFKECQTCKIQKNGSSLPNQCLIVRDASIKFGVWMLMLFIQDFGHSPCMGYGQNPDFRETPIIYIFTQFLEHIFYVDFIH